MEHNDHSVKTTKYHAMKMVATVKSGHDHENEIMTVIKSQTQYRQTTPRPL